MEPNETRALVCLANRRPRSFSEAADSVLDVLREAIPGVIALCRMNPDEQVHRVTETRGEGLGDLDRGAALPMVGDALDPDRLRARLGVEDSIGAPLETSDGRIVGFLCALDPRASAYKPAHAAQLGIAARLLSQEWESVELRSELRRLRRRLGGGPRIDAETGLPDRAGFLQLLDRERRLTERGSVESVLVVFRIGVAAENGNGAAGAQRRLALKVAADVLEASTRVDDQVGRTAEATLAAIPVGCRLQEAPAFVERFLEALGRVGEGRRPAIEVSCGVQPLAGTPSAEDALELAEAAAGGGKRSQPPQPVPGEALE